MKAIIVLISFLAAAIPACSSTPAISSSPALVASLVLADGDEEEEGHSFLVGALLYLPNRFLDAFDLFRLGVDVGPGVGVEAQATEAAQATFVSRLSAGAGYQTLRHLPAQVSSEAAVGVGPVEADARAGLPWHRSGTDFRLGLHVLLVGTHVAIDPLEIVDFPLGFFGVDLADDDF